MRDLQSEAIATTRLPWREACLGLRWRWASPCWHSVGISRRRQRCWRRSPRHKQSRCVRLCRLRLVRACENPSLAAAGQASARPCQKGGNDHAANDLPTAMALSSEGLPPAELSAHHGNCSSTCNQEDTPPKELEIECWGSYLLVCKGNNRYALSVSLSVCQLSC